MCHHYCKIKCQENLLLPGPVTVDTFINLMSSYLPPHKKKKMSKTYVIQQLGAYAILKAMVSEADVAYVYFDTHRHSHHRANSTSFISKHSR